MAYQQHYQGGPQNYSYPLYHMSVPGAASAPSYRPPEVYTPFYTSPSYGAFPQAPRPPPSLYGGVGLLGDMPGSVPSYHPDNGIAAAAFPFPQNIPRQPFRPFPSLPVRPSFPSSSGPRLLTRSTHPPFSSHNNNTLLPNIRPQENSASRPLSRSAQNEITNKSGFSPPSVSGSVLEESSMSHGTDTPLYQHDREGGAGRVHSPQDIAPDTPINALSRVCRFNKATSTFELVDEKGPAHLKVFVVKVKLSLQDGLTEEYLGQGKSIQKAKHEAAQQLPQLAALAALEYFTAEKEKKDAKKKLEQEEASRRTPLELPQPSKAPVTWLFEETRRLQLELTFDCWTSAGPAHCQTHHATCSVGTLESTGEGATKKEARQAAAEKMLVLLREQFGSVKPGLSMKTTTMTNGNSSNVAERNKSAQAVKVSKVRPEYGKHINPINRLFHLQQANGLPDPVFEMDAPSPSGRVKDFCATARIPGGASATAVGPNKRLAKRFAAENLLHQLGFQVQPPVPLKSSIRPSKPPADKSLPPAPATASAATEDRKVKFDLLHAECDDKANGRTYRKRFSKKPQPASMYPKNSVQETLYEARAPIPLRPGHEITPGILSLPRFPCQQSPPIEGAVTVGTISTIARELMADRHSPTAAEIVAERSATAGGGVAEADAEPTVKDAWLPLLEYLCRVVNMTLKKDTFSRQGPHCEFVTVLTVGEPINSIGCGNGGTEEKSVEDAAWNLLTVIGEQGDEEGYHHPAGKASSAPPHSSTAAKVVEEAVVAVDVIEEALGGNGGDGCGRAVDVQYSESSDVKLSSSSSEAIV
ncbi:putative Double-stranded RNA-binding protein Staufen-like protein 1 [Hypsibius exemplaris]|uniref:Double-stranded RNA-binding protein Staufen-like protein 1 n=1 Tax=Hypsibius exemplaris TaxID=2072580 RepID=A0A1W0WVS5_HYPEX|nr:putative Double-stranded RNA-binding protein Staufen-like protein 1 [Hypsibius exemplaris]